MTGFTTVALTGVKDNAVDALLSRVRWDGTVATYGFPDTKTDYGTYLPKKEPDGFVKFNGTQRQVARGAFTEADNYVNNLALVEVTPASQADMRLAMTSVMKPNSGGGFYPGDDQLVGAQGGDVWLSTKGLENPHLGNGAYFLIHHEIGHALGLKHAHLPESGVLFHRPDNNLVLARSGMDSHEFSIMTYHSYTSTDPADSKELTNPSGHFPQTFMMLDIAALQYMYGADYTTQSGDTTYRFDPATGETFINGTGQGIPKDDTNNNVNVIFRTIWDGGGTDTYDLSNYTNALTIDLRPGEWTTTSRSQLANLGNGHFARGNIANAFLYKGDTRSLIENAIGGTGDDVITGNQVDNKLNGGSGNDTLTGGPGKDQFIASTGNDKITDFNPDEDNLSLPGGTTISGTLINNNHDTLLTYPGGTLTLVGVNLSTHLSTHSYPWLKWSGPAPTATASTPRPTTTTSPSTTTSPTFYALGGVPNQLQSSAPALTLPSPDAITNHETVLETPSNLITGLAGQLDIMKDLIPGWIGTARVADASHWAAVADQVPAGFAMPGYFDTGHAAILGAHST